MNDTIFMKMALELAEKARGFTAPNPMVGAVVVKDGKVVGQGYHHRSGDFHGEVNALNDAGADATDATLYVTLEPCNHQGKTPPCTEAILKSGVKEVIVAMEDPNPHVKGNGIAFLKEKGLTVRSGVLRDYALKLNEAWLTFIRQKRPFITAKCAATLDGQTATHTNDSKWITGIKSRTFVHQLRREADGILVGVNTVKADNPRLTSRLVSGAKKNPIRIILDSRLSIPESSLVVETASETQTIIATTKNASQEKMDRLSKKGVHFIQTSADPDRVDMVQLMTKLLPFNIMHLLIEGGATILSSAFQAKIVDKVMFFFAPKILGGNNGIPILNGKGPDYINESTLLKDISVHQFNDDTLIEGYIA